MSFSREDLENHPESETPVDLLNMDTILAAEFNYAAQTAFQANEDRARVTSFYLVTVGSFLAAILSTQFITAPGELIYGGFSILFLVISLMGIITLLQLVRARAAWHESVRAMNQLKDFYIQHTPNYPLLDAFRWRTGSIPPRFKISSISFLLALEICLLGSFMFGAAVEFLILAVKAQGLWWSILAGLVFLVLQMSLYAAILRDAKTSKSDQVKG